MDRMFSVFKTAPNTHTRNRKGPLQLSVSLTLSHRMTQNWYSSGLFVSLLLPSYFKMLKYSVANTTLRHVSSLVYQICFKLRIHILHIVCRKVHKRCVKPKSLGLIAEVYGKTCNLTDLSYEPVFQSKSNALLAVTIYFNNLLPNSKEYWKSVWRFYFFLKCDLNILWF